ncbi:hypothetical protein [Streptomyces sp. NPDC051000]|uniref:hypothetical protein n=1 Tax=unclassified Streptomyces TaxID=2593676 RepID=UPI0033D004D4
MAGLLAAAVGVVINLVTDSPSWGLWVALVVLVLAGAGTQLYLNDGAPTTALPVQALGHGSVAVGGTAHGPIVTRVSGPSTAGQAGAGHGVTATGPGSVAIGGDSLGSVETRSEASQ